MKSQDLISPAYLQLQRQMHAAPRGYGQNGDKWAEVVLEVVRAKGIETVLDYGCGQGSLGRLLRAKGVSVAEYDPAVAGRETLPAPADLVVCTDVLEHVEEAHVGRVLDHLQALSRHYLFAVIATGPAGKELPDGRNAHILIRDTAWWTEQLLRRFDCYVSVACRSHKETAALWRAAGDEA